MHANNQTSKDDNPGSPKESGRRIYLHIAQQLHDQIKESSESQLPSIRDIARQYDISTSTALKAVRFLAGQGVVECFWGRRSAINRGGKSEEIAKGHTECGSCPGKDFYLKLKEQIQTGRRKVGETLPKFQFFVSSERLSKDSISHALQLLRRDNLVHKQGKKWIAGPPPDQTDASSGHVSVHLPPAVMVLWPRFQPWHSNIQHSESIYFPFFYSFSNEIIKYGTKLMFGFTRAGEPESGFVRGWDEIRAAIISQGERYDGALMVAGPGDEIFIRRLIRFRKPVVTFHRFLQLRHADFGRYFYFVGWDEEKAVALALDALVSAGHRVIGMFRPCLDNDILHSPWMNSRIELVRAEAERFSHPPQIVVIDQKETFWHDQQWREKQNLFPEFLRSMAKERQEAAAAARPPRHLSRKEALRECTPSMWSLVTHPGLTALIAANDMRARLYAAWCAEMGISIPGDLSLIGFDNDVDSICYSISTVDFRLCDVGYLAAHIFIGDIHVQIDRCGRVLSKPQLIDRGSVGPPGKLRVS